LLYATGGVGWAHNVVSANGTFGGFTAGGSVDNMHVGYTVGGGLEYAVAGPWTVKAEYLYYGLGDESYAGVNADLKISTVKLGLNYRF
jgi:outer membrane immunogenic protein